jgi:translation initiation factor 1
MPDDGNKAPFHNPFAALRPLRDSMPDAPARDPEPVPSNPPGKKERTVPRAVVRLERSGRGGKEVTVIDHLSLASGEREVWLKALKAGLGCGGVVEGESLVLQGDQRKRLPALLAGRGVRKVTVS